MNKIDQDKITPQILEKIKEVNDETGHRTHLEVPEMIRIICEVVEANYTLAPKQENPKMEFHNQLHCFKENKKSLNYDGMCLACGISMSDSSEFDKYHHAMI
jgi:hypothetical protein